LNNLRNKRKLREFDYLNRVWDSTGWPRRRRLEVPFRRVVPGSGDTGFGAAKTSDLQTCLPG
jgi:hypothetical protein